MPSLPTCPQADIATFLDIDAKTLRKRFRTELDRGSVEVTAKVAQSLFRMATDGRNVAAAIFWMKARAGWREGTPPGFDGEEERPRKIQVVIVHQTPDAGRAVIDADDAA